MELKGVKSIGFLFLLVLLLGGVSGEITNTAFVSCHPDQFSIVGAEGKIENGVWYIKADASGVVDWPGEGCDTGWVQGTSISCTSDGGVRVDANLDSAGIYIGGDVGYTCASSAPWVPALDSTPSACDDSQTILKLSSATNAHGELWNGVGNYPIEVCYDEIFGTTYDGENAATPHACKTPPTNKVLGLSAITNAHAQIPSQSTYPQAANVCYGDLNCTSQIGGTCPENYSSILSLSSITNAHIGAFADYTTRICCKSESAIGVSITTCGDGIVEFPPEECDDDNIFSGDGCSSNCLVEPPYICSGSPSVCTLCGDNITETPPEECDDGNLINGDGCSSTCNLEVPGTVCGNGIVESPPEECDDENIIGGDGCSADCLVEPPYICSGSPSICTAATWRDLSDEEITEFYAFLGQGEEILMVVENERILAGATSATFTVYKDNLIWFDREIGSEAGDAIMNGRMNGIFSVDDSGLGRGTYTLYFEVSVNGGEFDATSEELTLIVEDPDILRCEEVVACTDYTEDECGVLNCDIDYISEGCGQPTGETCDLDEYSCDYIKNCGCEWDSDAGLCSEVSSTDIDPLCMGSDCPNSLGQCNILQELVDIGDTCDDGFLNYKWSAIWDWKDNSYPSPGPLLVQDPVDGLWHYEVSSKASCVNGDSRAIPCPSMIALPFFGYLELLVTLILIALVYYFIFVFRNKGKKSLSKKKSKKKRR